jgi:hypothetical protein
MDHTPHHTGDTTGDVDATEVAVIGSGPAGLSCAAELAGVPATGRSTNSVTSSSVSSHSMCRRCCSRVTSSVVDAGDQSRVRIDQQPSGGGIGDLGAVEPGDAAEQLQRLLRPGALPEHPLAKPVRRVLAHGHFPIVVPGRRRGPALRPTG